MPQRERTALVLFTRDLRVHDQPALAAAAAEAGRVVPLFVFDDQILSSDFARPNRVRFLLDSLKDLDTSLTRRGARLVLRRGDVVQETMRVAHQVNASDVFVSADVSSVARRRERALQPACDEQRVRLTLCPGVTAVPPGELLTTSGASFRVFTAYWRRWQDAELRPIAPTPRRLRMPTSLSRGRLPSLGSLVSGRTSPELPTGGESAARARLSGWFRRGLDRYAERHDDLESEGTSRLSPSLHFGCLSPLEVVRDLHGRPGSEPFIRQLCWRDFYHQLLDADPARRHQDLRTKGDRWRHDPEGLAAWKEGRTGFPIVDAGMRQLLAEGWMHNRARLIVGSFLTKDLYIDWREGAAHFFDLLVDGDVANNVGNWQWVAGTGADTRPNRVFNPTMQAKRLDPRGRYVRRYVPELAGVGDRHIHEPWKLGTDAPSDYPAPILDHHEAAERFRRARTAATRA